MARLYLGSSSGLNDVTPDNWRALSRIGAFRTSVSTAGDVNGDGYGDIMVGEPYFSDDDRIRAASSYGMARQAGSARTMTGTGTL